MREKAHSIIGFTQKSNPKFRKKMEESFFVGLQIVEIMDI